MFGDPREIILKDIEKFTKESLSENFMESGVTSEYRQFGDNYADCLYLIMAKGLRVLVYGMERDRTPSPDYNYLFTEDAVSPYQDKVTLFCRSLELGNYYELSALLDAEDEYFIDAMEDKIPSEGDTNEDFFLRNAIWLMDPVIH